MSDYFSTCSVLRFFWISAFISPSGSRRQRKQVNHRTECSVTSCSNMITVTSKGRRDRMAFILLRCQLKDSLTLPFLVYLLPLLRSTSVPRWQAHFKLLSATCLSSAHTPEELKASVWPDSILKIIAISQQPFHYATFVKRAVPKMKEEHKSGKVSPEKSLHWQKMRREWEYYPLLP